MIDTVSSEVSDTDVLTLCSIVSVFPVNVPDCVSRREKVAVRVTVGSIEMVSVCDTDDVSIMEGVFVSPVYVRVGSSEGEKVPPLGVYDADGVAVGSFESVLVYVKEGCSSDIDGVFMVGDMDGSSEMERVYVGVPISALIDGDSVTLDVTSLEGDGVAPVKDALRSDDGVGVLEGLNFVTEMVCDIVAERVGDTSSVRLGVRVAVGVELKLRDAVTVSDSDAVRDGEGVAADDVGIRVALCEFDETSVIVAVMVTDCDSTGVGVCVGVVDAVFDGETLMLGDAVVVSAGDVDTVRDEDEDSVTVVDEERVLLCEDVGVATVSVVV
eukprot:PhM_4_TR8825/c0_g1_i1/m.43700